MPKTDSFVLTLYASNNNAGSVNQLLIILAKLVHRINSLKIQRNVDIADSLWRVAIPVTLEFPHFMTSVQKNNAKKQQEMLARKYILVSIPAMAIFVRKNVCLVWMRTAPKNKWNMIKIKTLTAAYVTLRIWRQVHVWWANVDTSFIMRACKRDYKLDGWLHEFCLVSVTALYANNGYNCLMIVHWLKSSTKINNSIKVYKIKLLID